MLNFCPCSSCACAHIRSFRRRRRCLCCTHVQTKAEAAELKHQVAQLEAERSLCSAQLLDEALLLPNISHPDAPVGDEDASRIVKQFGEPRRFDSFAASSHVELGQKHGWIDFEAGAVVTGQKFPFLRREAALLELALVQWAMNELYERGFELALPPDIVHVNAAAACGYQPRGASSQVYTLVARENMFPPENAATVAAAAITLNDDGDQVQQAHDADDATPTPTMCLVGTSEIPMTAQYAGRILDLGALPLRSAAFGHCFRAEAGATGMATAGLYRLHQFSKVEMVVVSDPSKSDAL